MARVYVGAVILTGAAVVGYSTHELISGGVGPLVLTLMVLTVVTGLAPLTIPKMPISFSISDTFSIVAALLAGPAAGALTAALDGLVITTRMPRTRRVPYRIMFNGAAPAVAIWSAAKVFVLVTGGHPLDPGILGALRLLLVISIFGAVNFAVNTGLVAGAVSLQRGLRLPQVWREHFSELWLAHFGGVFAAMLMMVLRHLGSLEVLVLLAPLPLILWVTFRQAVGRSEDHISHLGQINKVYVASIEALAQAVDTKDQVTHDHTRRVQETSVRLARRLNVTDDAEIQALKAAALLHDVGKIGVPEHILNKPGRLTASEFEIMKRHAPMGADILSLIGFPYPVVPIVRHHHENWNGSGYPDGLAGEQIPIGARILSVVDCFDALTSDRPYRPRLSDEDAKAIVRDRRGTMYDPTIVDEFFAMLAEDAGEQVTVDDGPVTPSTNPWATTAMAPTPSNGPEPVSETQVLEIFYRLGGEIVASMQVRDVGEIVWHHVSQCLPACSFVMYTYDDNGDALVPLFRSDDRVISRDARIPLGERLSGWVAAQAQTMVNAEARLDQDPQLSEAHTLRSALAVPVLQNGRIVGVMSFYAEEHDAFSPLHRHVAEAAASCVSALPLEAGNAGVAATANAA